LEQVGENKIKGIPVARGVKITHLIFVDDIILFGIGNMVEWKVYQEILALLCKATCMVISAHKSSFL
jgi:hypothetical protein